jgi:RNA polymerase sigma-70 factor (ECF subfamily)
MTNEMFGEKYLTYKQMVFQISYAYLRNVPDAEDASLDAFMKFYHCTKKFHSLNHERNYLIRVTINTAKDYLRRNRELPLNEEVHGVYDEEGELDKSYL